MDPIINIRNPINILSQPKSSLDTNPLIPNKQDTFEIEQPISGETIARVPFHELNQNIAKSCTEFLDDILNKPEDIAWNNYIIISLQKDNRYPYIGIMLLVVSIFTFMLLYYK